MSNKSTRITVDELSDYAAQGVERALEARKSAGIELGQGDLDYVSGGAAYSLGPGVLAGYWRDIILGGSVNKVDQVSVSLSNTRFV